MTREEAIKQLKENRVLCINSETEPFAIAYDMAIKALEQEPFINKPCISSGVCKHDKNEVLNKIRAEIMKLQLYKMFEGEDTFYIERDDALAIIDKYKAESEE